MVRLPEAGLRELFESLHTRPKNSIHILCIMKLETLYEPAAGADRQVEQEGDGGVERALQPRPALQTVAALLAHNYLEGNSGHMNQCHVRGAWRILENQNKFEIYLI